jgi:predicted ATPase
MIEKIHIENFKSIQNLDLELGRVNVFIGENGSGKTNILEAIGVCRAAYQNNLENTYLASIGIRNAINTKEFKSGFNLENISQTIKFTVTEKGNDSIFELNGNSDTLQIEKTSGTIGNLLMQNLLERLIENESNTEEEKNIFQEKIKKALIEDKKYAESTQDTINSNNSLITGLIKYKNPDSDYFHYAIFCPENTQLRSTDEKPHLRPIGVKGEGLLNYLSSMVEEKPEIFEDIKKHLNLFGWFKDFEIYKDVLSGASKVKLSDKYLAEGVKTLDLRNANEGFLFVLFYLTLFISKDTPKFFAIDNFDNALNPKLCKELLIIITQIAKENDKQVIFTTHNPAVLDGLNLNDEEQKLFTVFRSKKTGETKVNIFKRQPTPQGVAPARLSEMFMNGSLGGLPDNF